MSEFYYMNDPISFNRFDEERERYFDYILTDKINRVLADIDFIERVTEHYQVIQMFEYIPQQSSPISKDGFLHSERVDVKSYYLKAIRYGYSISMPLDSFIEDNIRMKIYSEHYFSEHKIKEVFETIDKKMYFNNKLYVGDFNIYTRVMEQSTKNKRESNIEKYCEMYFNVEHGFENADITRLMSVFNKTIYFNIYSTEGK